MVGKSPQLLSTFDIDAYVIEEGKALDIVVDVTGINKPLGRCTFEEIREAAQIFDKLAKNKGQLEKIARFLHELAEAWETVEAAEAAEAAEAEPLSSRPSK
jgi:hypothetical protein